MLRLRAPLLRLQPPVGRGGPTPAAPGRRAACSLSSCPRFGGGEPCPTGRCCDAAPRRSSTQGRKTMSQRAFMTALVAVVAACLGPLAGGGKNPGTGAGLAHAEQRKDPAGGKKEAAAQWEY